MAKLEKISNTSWRQPFRDREKEFTSWVTHSDVADYCDIKDGQDRCFRITFEDQFDFRIEFTGSFHISSGKEILFPAKLQKIIKPIISKNRDSFFIVEVLDYRKR